MFLSTVSPNLVTFQGTDLGRAIAAALQAFQDKSKDSKALILLTDGEDHNKGTMQIVKKAKDAGVRIFTIGIGTADGATLPDEAGQGNKKDRGGKVVISRLDETTLQRIARGTGGAYLLTAACAAGSAVIYVRNNTLGNLSEAVVIRFSLIKTITS